MRGHRLGSPFPQAPQSLAVGSHREQAQQPDTCTYHPPDLLARPPPTQAPPGTSSLPWTHRSQTRNQPQPLFQVLCPLWPIAPDKMWDQGWSRGGPRACGSPARVGYARQCREGSLDGTCRLKPVRGFSMRRRIEGQQTEGNGAHSVASWGPCTWLRLVRSQKSSRLGQLFSC